MKLKFTLGDELDYPQDGHGNWPEDGPDEEEWLNATWDAQRRGLRLADHGGGYTVVAISAAADECDDE
jgi:hypothetical protein